MNILFIMNGIGSANGFPGISGGDIRWIEIAKCWQKVGHDIQVLTPEAGVELCKRLGLRATFHVWKVSNEYSLRTYLSRFRKSWFVPKTLGDFRGIVYSTTEHMYDVLPAFKIKGFDKNNVWAAVVHWVAPLRRKGARRVNSILFFFNQRIGFRYIKNGADVILAISQNTAEQLQHIGISRNVFSVGAGVDYSGIREIASNIRVKKYDAAFMKRFDGTKGVFDVIEIWRDVVRARKDARLCMIGLGTREVMNKLRKMIETLGIKKNVDFLGPIYDFNSKFSVLASSKLLLVPSYEENWAIVIGEAMAAGVPVICYNLPAIKIIWHSNVTWVPVGNKSKFAERVITLLSKEDERRTYANKGTRYIKKYSWNSIADNEMSLILDSPIGSIPSS